MVLKKRDNEALRKFTVRVIDHLSDARPSTLRCLLREVLQGIGKRVGIEHAYLFCISGLAQRSSTVSLTVCASALEQTRLSSQLQKIPLTMFSSTIVEALEHRQTVFLPVGENGSNGTRLLTTLVKDAGTTGLLLCPIHLKQKLTGIIGLAHHFDKDLIDPEGCQQIRLIGQLMIQRLRSMKRISRQRRRHRQWKRIADSACDFAIVVSAENRVLQVLPFRSTAVPEMTGVAITSFLPDRSLRILQKAIRKSQTEQSPVSCELKAAWRIGEVTWFRVRVHSAHSDNQIMLYFTDIHADRSQQEQLEELEAHLQRASRLSLLGQVSTEFAHQINQPLQSILNHCGTMQYRISNKSMTMKKTAQSIRNIVAAVEHASTILTRIREFVQFRSLTIDAFKLVSVVESAVMMVENRAMDAGVKLVCRWRHNTDLYCGVSDVTELWAMIDKVQTTQILINLIVNAIEACEGQVSPRPQIDVCIDSERDPRCLTICIIDNGPGLPTENPEMVFEKFHTTKSEGLGIGLAVSRSVAEAQNGSLTATNNSDRGCTFCITVRRCSRPGSDTDVIETIPVDELPID